MYLIHNTTIDNLKLILEDGKIRSNKLTGKINEGIVYKTNNLKII